MKGFWAEECQSHDPQSFMRLGAMGAAEEVPERAVRLLDGGSAGGVTFERPEEMGLDAIAAVHTPEYLRFLQTIHGRWTAMPGASAEVIPNLHLDRTLGGYPDNAVGLAAYHQADAACPIGHGTWEGAYWSAQCAMNVADRLGFGDRAAYSLSRPPGHHAYADLAGGFCFLNNSAIVAQMLRRTCDRVAVLDVDVHHGNGTQGIFYKRGDVLTVSLHGDPVSYYPYMCGYAHERGAAAGQGYNLNIPLSRQTEDAAYLEALDRAIAHIQTYRPQALVLALGLDAHIDDPLKGMRLSTSAFSGIGKRAAAMDLPTAIIQEGGYVSDALGGNLTAFMEGFLGT